MSHMTQGATVTLGLTPPPPMYSHKLYHKCDLGLPWHGTLHMAIRKLNANPCKFLPLVSPAEGKPSSGVGQGASLSGLAGLLEQVGWQQGNGRKASRKWGDIHE